MKPEEITTIRKSLGLSQAEFANSLGVQTAAVSHWEKGRNSPTKVHQAVLKRLKEKASEETNAKDVIIGFAIAGGVTAFLAWLWSESQKKQ